MHPLYYYAGECGYCQNPPRCRQNVAGFEKKAAGLGRKAPPFGNVCLFNVSYGLFGYDAEAVPDGGARQ